MARHVSDIAFTPAVKAQQDRLGSRAAYTRMEGRGGWSDQITPELAHFVGERDSFYLGTASADGQPYIQHRGGPKGFLAVLNDRRTPCGCSQRLARRFSDHMELRGCVDSVRGLLARIHGLHVAPWSWKDLRRLKSGHVEGVGVSYGHRQKCKSLPQNKKSGSRRREKKPIER